MVYDVGLGWLRFFISFETRFLATNPPRLITVILTMTSSPLSTSRRSLSLPPLGDASASVLLMVANSIDICPPMPMSSFQCLIDCYYYYYSQFTSDCIRREVRCVLAYILHTFIRTLYNLELERADQIRCVHKKGILDRLNAMRGGNCYVPCLRSTFRNPCFSKVFRRRFLLWYSGLRTNFLCGINLITYGRYLEKLSTF